MPDHEGSRTIEQLISEYGLLVVWLGCALEGDTVAITAGVLSHKGLFPFGWTVFAVIAGGWTTDLLTFFGARYFREHPRVLSAVSHPFAKRMTSRFMARPLVLTAIFRFIPGARFLAPVLLATVARVKSKFYVPITFCSAVAWGLLLTTIGTKIGRIISEFWGYVWSPMGVIGVLSAFLLFYACRVVWRYWRAG